MANPIIIIPARMASERLPNKPLAQIGDAAMIIHVARRAAAADIAPVVIAAGDAAIAEIAEKEGFRAILTPSSLPSGSDRCIAALREIEVRHPRDHPYDMIINVQGDMPDIAPDAIAACYEVLASGAADLSTLVAPCHDEAQKNNPDQVKAVLAHEEGKRRAAVLYFSRNCVPAGDGIVWGHIGLYVWRREALLKFSALPPSPLEMREGLEQLRALEANMAIEAAIIDTPPLSVDSPADLKKAREMMGAGDGK